MADIRAQYERMQRLMAAWLDPEGGSPVPPCVGCPHIEVCAVERKACWRFYWYVNKDVRRLSRKDGLFKARWRVRHRPSKAVFNRVYKGEACA